MVVATIEVEEEDFVLVVWGSIIVKRRILFLKISDYSLEWGFISKSAMEANGSPN